MPLTTLDLENRNQWKEFSPYMTAIYTLLVWKSLHLILIYMWELLNSMKGPLMVWFTFKNFYIAKIPSRAVIYNLHESGDWAQSPKNGHHLTDLAPVGSGGREQDLNSQGWQEQVLYKTTSMKLYPLHILFSFFPLSSSVPASVAAKISALSNRKRERKMISSWFHVISLGR